MIIFHNDQLAPPELCQLLYQTVPVEYHAPVVFFNRPHPHLPTARGVCSGRGERIDICLNPIYNSATQYPIGCLAFSLWHQLVETCYHEFGHVATAAQFLDVSPQAYWGDRRAYRYVEDLAIAWSHRKLGELRDHDPRLAQPLDLTGYLGARLCKTLRVLNRSEHADVRGRAIKEWRCRRTGGQLSVGDVLKQLGISADRYSNVYRVVRQISGGIGSDVVDAAGRRHKLYTWGDVPVLGTRLHTCGLLRESKLVRETRAEWERMMRLHAASSNEDDPREAA